MHLRSHFSSWMQFFHFLDVSFENFKQLVLGHLDVHSGWELHRIHHHLTNENQYFDFHSIMNDFPHHFEKLTLSRTPTRWGCLEAPKGCPIRKYSGKCLAPWAMLPGRIRLNLPSRLHFLHFKTSVKTHGPAFCSRFIINFWSCTHGYCCSSVTAIYHFNQI